MTKSVQLVRFWNIVAGGKQQLRCFGTWVVKLPVIGKQQTFHPDTTLNVLAPVSQQYSRAEVSVCLCLCVLLWPHTAANKRNVAPSTSTSYSSVNSGFSSRTCSLCGRSISNSTGCSSRWFSSWSSSGSNFRSGTGKLSTEAFRIKLLI